MFSTFHFTACRIQYLFIFSLPGDKEFRKLVDREFAAKVAFKDGRKSNLTVAGKIKVCAVIDARGTALNGIWEVDPVEDSCF